MPINKALNFEGFSELKDVIFPKDEYQLQRLTRPIPRHVTSQTPCRHPLRYREHPAFSHMPIKKYAYMSRSDFSMQTLQHLSIGDDLRSTKAPGHSNEQWSAKSIELDSVHQEESLRGKHWKRQHLEGAAAGIDEAAEERLGVLSPRNIQRRVAHVEHALPRQQEGCLRTCGRAEQASNDPQHTLGCHARPRMEPIFRAWPLMLSAV